MVVGSKQRINSLVGDLTFSLNDISLRKVKSTKCLGVTIDEFLTWAEHIDNVDLIKKLAIGISCRRIRWLRSSLVCYVEIEKS